MDKEKQKKRQRRLMGDERKQRILEILTLQGRLTVEELVEKLNVTAVTVRADLNSLANSGLLARSRGGALKLKQEDPAPEYPFSIREHLHKPEKERIAKAAVELIRPGQTILLDSGSTTMEIARRIRTLKIHPLTVITNSLQIATVLAGLPSSLDCLAGRDSPAEFIFHDRSLRRTYLARIERRSGIPWGRWPGSVVWIVHHGHARGAGGCFDDSDCA